MKSIREIINETRTINEAMNYGNIFHLCQYFDVSSRKLYDWMMNLCKSMKKKPIEDISFEYLLNSSVLDKAVTDLIKEYSKDIDPIRLSTTERKEIKKYLVTIIFNAFEDEYGQIPNWSDDEKFNYMDIDW